MIQEKEREKKREKGEREQRNVVVQNNKKYEKYGIKVENERIVEARVCRWQKRKQRKMES